MRRTKENPQVATLGEVWEGLKGLPRDIWEIALMPSTWLCFLLMTLLLALYVLLPALLLSYLPARLFGATKGTTGLDISLGILLSIIGGLFVWGKIKKSRGKKSLAESRQQGCNLEKGVGYTEDFAFGNFKL